MELLSEAARLLVEVALGNVPYIGTFAGPSSTQQHQLHPLQHAAFFASGVGAAGALFGFSAGGASWKAFVDITLLTRHRLASRIHPKATCFTGFF